MRFVRIKSQIIVTILSAAALIALVGGIAVFTQMALTKSLALTEATSVARELAETIAFKAPDEPRPLFERPDALRAFVTSQHQRAQRDFIVVDRDRTILAVISDEDRTAGQS